MEGNRVAGLLPLLVSGNQGERSGATMVLREMETQPGFSAHLLEIGARGDVGAQVRWLAMMYLKNQVHRFWVKRSGIPYEIEAAEKSVIRENILPLSLDVDDSIANQSALIVAKISRFDFPKVWPNVLENIISALQAVSSESDMADSEDKVRRCNRVMRVLHYSIKDLSSKRLVSDRKTFLQLAPAVVAAVVQLWFIFRSKYISSWSTQSVSEGIIQGLVLTVKTLRRLLVSGFQKLHCDEQATSIAVSVSQFFRDLVASTGNTSASSSGTLERVAYFHGKFVHNVLAAQPLALVSEVDGMFVHYFSLCDISVSPRMITPKLQIVLLRCLHATVSSSKFIPSMQGISRAGDDPVLQQFIENVKKNLVADGLMKIIRGMTCQFVKVKAEEVEEVLEAGVNQLDAFERDEEDELESAGMSECGPAAYFALSIIDALLCRYGSTALHVLVLLQREALETSSLLPPQSVEADLVREACYHVIGSACVTMIKAKDLFEQVVVVDMAKSYLQNEFERFYGQQGEAHPTLILALRRAVWMLGKLVQADVSEEGGGIKKGNTQVSPLHSSLVPLLYSALEFPCTAVQVAAAASLVVEPEASDDWFDRASLLLPQGDVHCFLPAVCSTILKVSSAEDSLEVKNVAVSMLRGLASQIDPKSDQGSSFFHFLLPTISSLWLIIGSERRLQVSLLHVILDSANEDVMSANPDIFCQIIEAALAQEVLNEASSPAGGGSVILMETATDLWLKLMSTASSVEKHISLFARILPAIQVSRGPRETILRVMEAYLLLGGWERCQHVMLELSYLLSTSCREMNLRELRWSLNICEISLALGPREVYDKFAGLLMVATAQVLLHKAGDTVAAALFSCLAGLTFLIGSEEPIMGILAEVNKQEGAHVSIEQFLDVWLETWDACLTLERRRINCLGLARLLGCGSPPFAQRVSVILNFFVDFNGEELVEDDKTSSSSSSPVQRCRKQLWKSCYAQAGGLAAFFRSMMEQGRMSALSKYGEEGRAFFDQNLNLIDPQLMLQLA